MTGSVGEEDTVGNALQDGLHLGGLHLLLPEHHTQIFRLLTDQVVKGSVVDCVGDLGRGGLHQPQMVLVEESLLAGKEKQDPQHLPGHSDGDRQSGFLVSALRAGNPPGISGEFRDEGGLPVLQHPSCQPLAAVEPGGEAGHGEGSGEPHRGPADQSVGLGVQEQHEALVRADDLNEGLQRPMEDLADVQASRDLAGDAVEGLYAVPLGPQVLKGLGQFAGPFLHPPFQFLREPANFLKEAGVLNGCGGLVGQCLGQPDFLREEGAGLAPPFQFHQAQGLPAGDHREQEQQGGCPLLQKGPGLRNVGSEDGRLLNKQDFMDQGAFGGPVQGTGQGDCFTPGLPDDCDLVRLPIPLGDDASVGPGQGQQSFAQRIEHPIQVQGKGKGVGCLQERGKFLGPLDGLFVEPCVLNGNGNLVGQGGQGGQVGCRERSRRPAGAVGRQDAHDFVTEGQGRKGNGSLRDVAGAGNLCGVGKGQRDAAAGNFSHNALAHCEGAILQMGQVVPVGRVGLIAPCLGFFRKTTLPWA